MAGVDVRFVTHIMPVMAAHLYPTSAVNHTRTVSFARGSTGRINGKYGYPYRLYFRRNNFDAALV